jgi:ABC-type nitrate/sulfonate/bicarbonate transport system permease component
MTGFARVDAEPGEAAAAGPAIVTRTSNRRIPRPLIRVLVRLRNLWLLVLVLVVWDVWARQANTLFLPPISKIAERFWSEWITGSPRSLFLSDAFYDALGPSLSRFFAGWLSSVVVGVGLGIVLGRSRVAYAMYSPAVRFFLSMPKVALLPIAVQLFGITSAMNIALIFIGCLWIVTVNTMDGISGIHQTYLRSARSLRLGKLALYRDVIIPAASPRIFAGIRVSLGMGLVLTIVSEFYATTSGIGYQIQFSQQSFRYLDMWSEIMLVAIVGIVLNAGMNAVEGRVLKWQK